MKVPYTNFRADVSGEVIEKDIEDIFLDKKVVVFAVPGAFFNDNSAKQLQDYELKYNEIKSSDIDEVYCISVNDDFVMNAWFKEQNIKYVKLIGDGEGVFTQGMGMLINKPKLGFGLRSWRYSMLVDNKEVVKVFEEDGKNNASDDNDPFKVSDVDTMIKYLKEKTDV